jgi:hypothetical protein
LYFSNFIILLGLDVKSGCLFCAKCNNFVYSDIVDEVFATSALHAEEKSTRFQGIPYATALP